MAQKPRSKKGGDSTRATGLRVKIDANHVRTLTLAAHEFLIARALPEIFDDIVMLAQKGQCFETVTLSAKNFRVRDTQGLLLSLKAKLDDLGFTVQPVMHERSGVGYIQAEPALEVSWL